MVYRVFFNDGNIKLYETENWSMLINFLLFDRNYRSNDIYKIEVV